MIHIPDDLILLFDKHRFHYDEAVLADIARMTELTTSARVLQYGIGTGHATEYFAKQGYELTAVDNSVQLVRFVRSKCGQTPNVELKALSANAMLPAEPFGCVMVSDMPDSGVEKATAAFQKLHNVLDPSGVLVAWWSHQKVLRCNGEMAEPLQQIHEQYQLPVLDDLTEMPEDTEKCLTSAGFVLIQRKAYRRTREYLPAEFVELLQTYPHCYQMPFMMQLPFYNAIHTCVSKAGTVLVEECVEVLIGKKE